MTRNICVMFVFILLCVFVPSHAHAQTNFVFSSFQCDPVSCESRTSIPVFQATVNVDFIGTCTGGAVPGIEAFATAFVGSPEPCQVPYTPVASVVVSTQEMTDDFGCNPFFVDTETTNADVLDVLGNPVFHKSSSASCDGGTSGPFSVGARPC
jgi:hypothetical protein